MTIPTEQRARLLAVINGQSTNPPAPRLSADEIDEIRTLLESEREGEAWAALNEKWNAAFLRAHEAITRQSAEIVNTVERQKMGRRPPELGIAMFQVRRKVPVASTPALTATPEPFRPRVAWQIALFDAWPEICKAVGHSPTAAEAIVWLQQNDTSRFSMQNTGAGFCWKAQDSEMKEVELKTVETVLSLWRNAGFLADDKA